MLNKISNFLNNPWVAFPLMVGVLVALFFFLTTVASFIGTPQQIALKHRLDTIMDGK